MIDGLTGDQRFFIGWGQAWRSKYRDAELARRLATDPHSPPEFRCNGVRPQPARVLRGVRCQGGRQALAAAGTTRTDLVTDYRSLPSWLARTPRHSAWRASIGSSLEALLAGKYPKITPTTIDTDKDPIMVISQL